jgi:integrase/recombinase XerD
MLQTDPAAIPRLTFTGETQLLDRRGNVRSPITLPAYHAGKPPANKGRKYPPEVLTADECYRLMDACGTRPAGDRNRALIATMWRAGLRCAEACALYPKDVELDRGRITVLNGKGSKRRVCAIDPGGAEILRAWEARRIEVGIPRTDAYFCVVTGASKGLPISTEQVRETFKRLRPIAGIEKRVHPHGLRHSFAAYLAELGVPLMHIQAALGHTSLAVTERYVSHLNPSVMLDTLCAVEWPSRE